MNDKQKPTPKAPEIALPDATCKCGGPYYSIMAGELRCTKCKGRSPKARLEKNQIIRIKA